MKTTEHNVKIDFHVHSPASIDYVGNKSARGYAELVKAFVDEDVDAIAITDHNTIKGYLEYYRQAEMSRQTYRLMAARDDNSEVVKDLKSETDRFDRLRVFPGVEITAYPNLHVILIFDNSVVPQVTDFLTQDLELQEAVENGDPKKCSKKSIIDLLDLATKRFGDRFFCILPHVESSKGAWSVLEGAARVDIFRDERVVAAQFSNPDTVHHISKILANGTYKRKNPLAFIQSSDYHGDPNVKPASQFSMLKASRLLGFDELKKTLINPMCVRCSHEFVEDRLESFLGKRSQVQFEFANKFEVDSARRKDLARALCGILNTPSAVIRLALLNVAETVEGAADQVSKLFKDLVNDLDPIDSCAFTIRQFHQSTFRQRFCITIDRNSKLRLLDGICWVINGTTTQPAPAWRIEQIVAQAHYSRVGKNKQRALESASTHLIRVSNAFPAMPIAARLEPLLSRKRCGAFEPKMVTPNYPTSLKDDLGCTNGYVEGDFIQIQPDFDLKGGRLKRQRDYFRFTAPVFKYAGRKTEEGEAVGPNCGLVFPEGGAIYVAERRVLFAPFPVFEVKLAADHNLGPGAEEEMSLGFTAWMKSSFLLWYLNSVYQTDDVFDILLQNRRVPLTGDDKFIRSLSKFAKNIIVTEHSILKATAHVNPSKEDLARNNELLTKHNTSVRANMRLIDRQVFRHLAFSEDEVREVYRVLRALDLYDYDISLTLEEFVKEVTGPE